MGSDWNNVAVGQISDGDRGWAGRSIAEIARMRGEDPWTTFFELCTRYRVYVNPQSMNEEQKHFALRAPFVALCTDSEPINPATSAGAHPRGFGAFPRVLAKYVRGDRVIPLEEAVRKMTSLPANRLRLYDRGRIAPGMAADLVVFDPVAIQDNATFVDSLRLPAGIRWVLVNGQVVMDDGRWTKAPAGRLLKPAQRRTSP